MGLTSQVYDNHGFPLEWKPGDVAVWCNFLFAHGRPEFSPPPGTRRVVGVLLGPKFRRQGPRPGKWH